jgi:hypothetical protein
MLDPNPDQMNADPQPWMRKLLAIRFRNTIPMSHPYQDAGNRIRVPGTNLKATNALRCFDHYREGQKYLYLLNARFILRIFKTTAAEIQIETQTYKKNAKTIAFQSLWPEWHNYTQKTFSVCETYRFYICWKDLFAVEPVLLPACDPDQVSRH